MAPSDSRYWDGVAGAWRDRPQKLWRRHCDAVNAELFSRWLPPHVERVLKTDLFDEAVGEGLDSLVSSRASRFVAIDISPSIAVAAQLRHPAVVAVAADVRRLPFADDVFDAVISDSTLDHFETEAEIVDSLRELARVLKSGGRLIVTLDNPSNPLVWVRNAAPLGWLMRLRVVPYKVGATMGRRRLEQTLAEVGLAVSERGAIMHCPRMPAVLVSDLLDRMTSPGEARPRGGWWLAFLRAWERLAALPTRYMTGYFVAVLATKSGSDE